jgi:DNA-directed RNA polymerase specialized sigma24 family protein
MPIDAELLDRARRYDRTAVEAIFTENYPALYRMSLGLSGRLDVGLGVLRFVVKQALRVLPSWKDEDAPQRWFLHHTILTVRRASKHQPNQTNDVLLDDPKTATTGYLAFIRALRGLPMQQREAYILRHGEHLNERYISVAMDCSLQATANHLAAATDGLRLIAGPNLDVHTEQMSRIYRALAPQESLMLPKLRRTIARHIWPRRILRALGWLIILAFACAIAYAAWKIWPMLEF